jgi:glycosyltransferase involved in cell wall biosynthesis
MSQNGFDVSIVLNLHNEARYLRRTLRSLEEAAGFAKHYGITTELVAVVDRPDAATKAWVSGYDFSTFDAHQIVDVENGDLGLSRNDGINRAQGEVLILSDADDLISFNALSETFFAVKAADDKTVFVPQYLLGFGGLDYYCWEYFSLDRISTLSFFDVHPYISRIAARRGFLSQFIYQAASKATAYAYEDWHLNCEVLAAGGRFDIVKNTILFYRQRADGMLRTAQKQRPIIAPSSLFFPKNYLSTCTSDQFKPQPKRPGWEEIRTRVLASDAIAELMRAANAIDPFISYARFEKGGFGCNVPESDAAGRAYFSLCKLVGDTKFTDVVLMPFLTIGGADKYILQVLEGLAKQDPARRFLVLFGQRIDRYEWLDQLPSKSFSVDLYRICAEPTPEAIELLTLRIIHASAPSAEIHIKACEYANEFIRRHRRRLASNKLTFYYFCEVVTSHRGLHFFDGANLNFISDVGESLARIVSDHRANIDRLEQIVDLPETTRKETLYAICDAEKKPRITPRRQARALLWASRLDQQKRPDLLLAIAGIMHTKMPSHRIDVYGSTVLDHFDMAKLDGLPNVTYKGAFSEFGAIPADAYDGFLYTSLYDGLPNVILEAMTAGLPVIAPDVGGIGEAVSADTGFLVESTSNDSVLVARYIEAIEALYDPACDVEAKCRNALQLIRERHSKEAHLRRLTEIFGLDYQEQRIEAAE